MFGYATVGEWARREALLVSCVTAALALVALAEALGIGAMRTVGLLVAALGALGRLGIAWRRVALERSRERAELGRRTRVAVAPIESIDPTAVGIDAAAPQTVIPGGTVPEYLPRQADDELRAAVRAALGGEERWIVVAVGTSKVGKSRALFEALRHCARSTGVDLVAPVDVAALKGLVIPGETPPPSADGSVLWLDDLEPFLNQGLTFPILRVWRQANPGGIVAATFGGKGSDTIAESGSKSLSTVASEILQHAHEVTVRATTEKELESLRSTLPQEAMEAIERHGLAAYLVAAPELERKLTTGRHALDEPKCPEGVAVVRAVVDWARCGRTDPLSAEALRELWRDYLSQGVGSSSVEFEAGLAWAVRPVAGTIALVEQGVGYRAYDYVVSLVTSSPNDAPPPDAVWTRAVADTEGAEALAVGASAFVHDRYEPAVEGFAAARRDQDEVIAAVAAVNMGAALSILGRDQEALAVYEEFVERFGQTDQPTLREGLARVLYERALALGKIGRVEEELAAYDEMDDLLGGSEEMAVLIPLANGLVNKVGLLVDRGRLDEAIALGDEVIARFGHSEESLLREQVTKALVNRANVLGRKGDLDGALATYGEVLERVAGESDPLSRETAAATLVNLGVAYLKLGRNEEAGATFDEMLARFAEDDEPGLREQVAKALVAKGTVFERTRRWGDAFAVYREFLTRFEPGAEEGRHDEGVALVLLHAGEALSALGQFEDAISLYDPLITQFADADLQATRESCAQGWVKKALILDALGRQEEAIVVYEQMLAKFGDAEGGPDLDVAIVRAMTGLGFCLGKLDRSDEAIAAFDRAIDRFDLAGDPDLIAAIATSLLGKAQQLEGKGRLDEALSTHAALASRVGEANDFNLRLLLARSMFARARALERHGRAGEAAAAHGELADWLRAVEDPVLREEVARTLEAVRRGESAEAQDAEAAPTADA